MTERDGGAHAWAPGIAELAGALEDEGALVGALREALVRQRGAVAANDTAAVEAGADDVGRVLVALGEARGRRAEIVHALAGDAALPVSRLETALGTTMPDRLAAARVTLRRAAEGAAREAAINHAVLRRAVESGDAFLQALFAAIGPRASVYRADERAGADAPGSGVLVNKVA